MGKTYVEPGRAAVTGVFAQRQGGVSYGNFTAADLPTVNDDLTLGYAPGSLWHYTDRSRTYVCIDATEGAAIWDDLGEAQKLTILCRNDTGSTITKGSIVYVTGATGDHPTIALADKDSENTSSRALGMAVADILDDEDGFVAVAGTVDKLNTNSYIAGTALWLGDNGGWTDTKPVPPAHAVFVGWVARQNTNNGRIVLHIQNGYELDELHDVLITTTPTNGEVLAYETSSSLWKPKRHPRVVYSNVTVAEVETEIEDVAIYSVPANLLSTDGDSLRATYYGTNVDPTVEIAVYFGATKIAEITDLGGGVWKIVAELHRVTSSLLRGNVYFSYSASGVIKDEIVTVSVSSLNLVTTAYDLYLKIDTTAADIATLFTGRVELLPAP